ncbi:MAG: hypothetical protein GX558_00185 [Clostridiales bacterium]|mgnify:CR=1 FL=1|nr:hypothetical protein [Clostridiales bacterium]
MAIVAVRRMLAEVMGADESTIGPAARLWRAIDAVSLAKLIIACERRFGVDIEDELVSGFRRVRDLEDYIERRLAEGKEGAPATDHDRAAWYYE